MNVSVERYLFFPRSDGGHLRWAETHPHRDHAEGMVCSCTSNAETRPKGAPSESQQTVTILGDNVCLDLREDSFWIVFGKRHKDHRYFIFNLNQPSVTVEALEGHGVTEYFNAHLFFGLDIDTSTLMNGHSPTRLNLSSVTGQYWLHECSWGKEGLRVLTSEPEIALWNRAFELRDKIYSEAKPYLLDKTGEVANIHQWVSTDKKLLEAVNELFALLQPMALNLPDTELFKLWASLRNETIGEETLARMRAMREVN